MAEVTQFVSASLAEGRSTSRALISALAVALLAGCGADDASNSGGAIIALPTTTPGVQCYLITDIIECTPAVPPICGPGPSCPTPTPTPDSSLHVSCPVTPGETVVIDGTPFVILARACTRTPTPNREETP